MDILSLLIFINKYFIIQKLILLIPLILYLVSNIFLIKRIFDNYEDKYCDNKNIYKCTKYTKWGYLGIIFNLIWFSILLLGVFVPIFIQLNTKTNITIPIKLFILFPLSVIFILAIIGHTFLLQQSKLPCDKSFICLDTNEDIKLDQFKNVTIKISGIVGIIISIIFIICIAIV